MVDGVCELGAVNRVTYPPARAPHAASTTTSGTTISSPSLSLEIIATRKRVSLKNQFLLFSTVVNRFFRMKIDTYEIFTSTQASANNYRAWLKIV